MTRPSLFAALALVVSSGALSGCFTFRAQLPGTLREPAPREDIVVVGHFDHDVTQVYLFWGLANPPPHDLFKEPMRRAVEEAGGDGMANIIVDTRFKTTDVVLQQLTLGVVSPRSYRMRADIVRLTAPPVPGKPLLKPGQRSRDLPAPAPLDPPPPLAKEPPR